VANTEIEIVPLDNIAPLDQFLERPRRSRKLKNTSDFALHHHALDSCPVLFTSNVQKIDDAALTDHCSEEESMLTTVYVITQLTSF